MKFCECEEPELIADNGEPVCQKCGMPNYEAVLNIVVLIFNSSKDEVKAWQKANEILDKYDPS